MSTIQDALTGLSFTETIEDDELVSDAIVLIRQVHKDTGRETFTIANSDGINGLTQLGLIVAAYDVIRSAPMNGASE